MANSQKSTNLIHLAQNLVRCPSVTPQDKGALDLCESYLSNIGFETWRLPFGEVDNLFARLGSSEPHLCFAGHTDVVPPGDKTSWTYPPFDAVINNGVLYGRGSEDMKGNVAAALAAVEGFVAENPGFRGSISFLLTGDEEGPALNGTTKVLEWMASNNQIPNQCVVIEPTGSTEPGDTLKIGRRGSMNATLTVVGKQGHAAYPSKADNPLPRLIRLLASLIAAPLDDGTDHFEPSSLEITSVDVGNPASNVIPKQGQARFNSRFNDLWTPKTLEAEFRSRLDGVGVVYSLQTDCNAISFITPPEKLAVPLADALQQATGRRPTFSTEGGTSDARFIQKYCPVVELGLVGKTMHQVDEHVPIADIERLKYLYQTALEAFLTVTAEH